MSQLKKPPPVTCFWNIDDFFKYNPKGPKPLLSGFLVHCDSRGDMTATLVIVCVRCSSGLMEDTEVILHLWDMSRQS